MSFWSILSHVLLLLSFLLVPYITAEPTIASEPASAPASAPAPAPAADEHEVHTVPMRPAAMPRSRGLAGARVRAMSSAFTAGYIQAMAEMRMAMEMEMAMAMEMAAAEVVRMELLRRARARAGMSYSTIQETDDEDHTQDEAQDQDQETQDQEHVQDHEETQTHDVYVQQHQLEEEFGTQGFVNLNFNKFGFGKGFPFKKFPFKGKKGPFGPGFGF